MLNENVKGGGWVHDFGQTRQVGQGLIKGTLLVWILNSWCFDHGDVTWDYLKGGSFGKQRSFLNKEFWGILGRVVNNF